MSDEQGALIASERLYFRPVTVDDAEGKYLAWLNDEEVTRYLETGRFPTSVEGLRAYVEQKTASTTDVFFAIVERATGAMIGTVKLGAINWIHRTAELGILIGERSKWSQGYGTEACRLLLRYGFERLNLHKVILGVVADHAAALRAYETVGFRREGLITDCIFLDGTYRDKVMMGISRQQFEQRSDERRPKGAGDA